VPRAFDLLGHVEQHVDLALLGAAFDHALHNAHHPAGAFAARRALAAALVLEESGDAPDGRITMSVDLSMTIMPPVPKDDFFSRRPSKSIGRP
jgi:hypothetical protein